jgi:hypothetical protein
MVSSGMLRHVVLVRTDISKECIASIIRVTRISELVLVIIFLHSMLRLLVIADTDPSSLILVTMMMEPHSVTSQCQYQCQFWF